MPTRLPMLPWNFWQNLSLIAPFLPGFTIRIPMPRIAFTEGLIQRASRRESWTRWAGFALNMIQKWPSWTTIWAEFSRHCHRRIRSFFS